MENELIKKVKCRNCGMECVWIKSKIGKWYLTPVGMDGKIYKVHGKNGMFYPIHDKACCDSYKKIIELKQ